MFLDFIIKHQHRSLIIQKNYFKINGYSISKNISQTFHEPAHKSILSIYSQSQSQYSTFQKYINKNIFYYMKLYSPEGHYKTNRIIAVANLYNIKLQLVPSSFNSSPSKQFLKKHPHAKLPALQTSEGFLFGAATIIRYIAQISQNSNNQTIFAKTSIDQWIDFSQSQIESKVGILYLQAFGIVKYQKQKWDTCKKQLFVGIKFLDNILKTKTYLVGDNLTIADLSVAGVLQVAFRLILQAKARNQYPHLTRWFSNVSSLPPFVDAFGNTHLCQQEFKFHVQQ